jgi:hypothetical protein
MLIGKAISPNTIVLSWNKSRFCSKILILVETYKKILKKGWTISLTLKPEESYALIFSAAGNQLGFCRSPVTGEVGVVETAFERALAREEQLKTLSEKRKQEQPLLYGDDL